MNIEVTADEVYYSYEYQQYLLILDEEAAYYYAHQELVEARRREAMSMPVAPPPTYKEWYLEYLRSEEWRARAAAAKSRFGGRCALCNSDQNLEAHHRTYDRVGNELPEDLTALCHECHRAYSLWRKALPPIEAE